MSIKKVTAGRVRLSANVPFRDSVGPATMMLKWDCNVLVAKEVLQGMGEAIRSFNDRYIAQCAGAGDEGSSEPAHVNHDTSL